MNWFNRIKGYLSEVKVTTLACDKVIQLFIQIIHAGA